MASGFGLASGLLTTYVGPGATGSGVAELIGYLNGVNYPNFIGIRTLVVKIVGVTFAVLGHLCVGKEGPLAHIGGILGIMVIHFPGIDFDFLKNDEKKRCFVAAGASAGVSVAFGAPIGGALFAYEMSKPNTFWRFSMIWKVFFSCALATFTMAFWTSLKNRDFINWSGSSLKFGSL
jgi:chloride channel 7